MEVSVSDTVDWTARPEVHQFRLFSLANHDVLRLDVTMTDIIWSQPIHSSDYAIDKPEFLSEREQFALGVEQLAQVEGIWIHDDGNILSVFWAVPVVSRHIAATALLYVKDEVQFVLERVFRLRFVWI